MRCAMRRRDPRGSPPDSHKSDRVAGHRCPGHRAPCGRRCALVERIGSSWMGYILGHAGIPMSHRLKICEGGCTRAGSGCDKRSGSIASGLRGDRSTSGDCRLGSATEGYGSQNHPARFVCPRTVSYVDNPGGAARDAGVFSEGRVHKLRISVPSQCGEGRIYGRVKKCARSREHHEWCGDVAG